MRGYYQQLMMMHRGTRRMVKMNLLTIALLVALQIFTTDGFGLPAKRSALITTNQKLVFSAPSIHSTILKSASNDDNDDDALDDIDYDTNRRSRRSARSAKKTIFNPSFNSPETDQDKAPKGEFPAAAEIFKASTSTPEGTKNFTDRPGLAWADFFAIFLFALIGTATHAPGGPTIIDINRLLIVGFPFWASWFALSDLAGAYRVDLVGEEAGIVEIAGSILTSWLVCVPAGIMGRCTIKGALVPGSFIIVTMISTFVLLTLTRWGYSNARRAFAGGGGEEGAVVAAAADEE